MEKIKQDIICALSTPPGIGAIALIRVTGQGCWSVVQEIFSKKITHLPTHTAIHGWIVHQGIRIDEVVLTLYRAPHSYTGEDVAEIACHGSTYIQQSILNALLLSGASAAKPGEFTLRAYLNGKMDLSEAEAVADLISSENEAQHRQAIHQMRGGFSKDIHDLRERLIHFASLVELELDFSEEEVEFANRGQLKSLVEEITEKVNRLRDSFSLGNAIKNGVPVAILGAPNMGKSTLLNALMNDERAIVSEIAGTTRDTIEDQFVLGGIRFIFIDTAGIRHTHDAIEQMGIARSFNKARGASVILLMFDAVETTREELQKIVSEIRQEAGDEKHILLIANKIDKPGYTEKLLNERTAGMGEVLPISAKSGTHLDRLRKWLLAAVHSGNIHSGETIVTNVRHFEALSRASQSLADVMNGLNTQISSDFLAIDIRKTLYHLGEITGTVHADDLLNSIFSRFCIGK